MKTKSPANRSAPVDAGRRKRANRRSPALALRRILVPLDFSGQSRQALEVAIPLAEQYGGKIVLIHVVEPVYHASEAGFAFLPETSEPLVARARARLRETAAQLMTPGLLDKAVVCEGSAYNEITSAARSLKVDLVVIATHGRTGLTHALLGGTAERVVRHAPCPVLTVRRRGLEAQGSRL